MGSLSWITAKFGAHCLRVAKGSTVSNGGIVGSFISAVGKNVYVILNQLGNRGEVFSFN